MKANERNGPVVYIACAYSGDIKQNTARSRAYSKAAIEAGAVPINPILNLTGVLSEETDRDTAMAIDLSLLKKADELWVHGIPTEGVMQEIAEAKRNGITIRYLPDTEGRVAGGDTWV